MPRTPGVPLLRGASLAALLMLAQSTPERGEALAQAQPPAAEAEAAGRGPERKAALDALFSSLRSARGDAEAAEYVAEIWRTWTQSGRADVDALMSRAGAHMAGRDYGIASMLLDEVVELAPGFAEGWNRRATLRYIIGDHDGSLADIARVLALEPRHFGALAGRAMIHVAAERWKEALAAYREALAANPFLAERHAIIPAIERKAEGEKL